MVGIWAGDMAICFPGNFACIFIPRAPGNWKDVRAVGDKIKVQSDDGAPDCMEQRRWAGYGERKRGQSHNWVDGGAFRCNGKICWEEVGGAGGGNDQGFGVYDAFKTSKC